MAKFCKACYVRVCGGTEKDLRHALMSKVPELCEGCGQYKPVVVKLRASLLERLIAKL